MVPSDYKIFLLRYYELYLKELETYNDLSDSGISERRKLCGCLVNEIQNEDWQRARILIDELASLDLDR